MAARNQLQALRNHPGLKRFCIPSARITCEDKVLGVGSYGRVVELTIDGTICAGKIMHEVLMQGSEIAQKYVEECQLMSDIRHPNIVQFLGVCFLPSSSLPVLVLERLLMSFDDLLEKKPKEENRIPLCIKRSILADVAKGLIYLHSRNPQVIHRDLSAKNILLNSSLQAKISDLGNSRIIDFRMAQRSMTRIPGAPAYMPPEAFGDSFQGYGPQLDSFSFGHLTLFAVIQVFPCDILPATYPDPNNPGCVIGRTEIERRKEYIKLLHQQLERHHPLVQLVNQCLHNDPSQRPSANRLLQRLQDMEGQIESPYGHLTTLEMMARLQEYEPRMYRYRKERDQARKQVEDLQAKLQDYETRICEECDQAQKQIEEMRAKLHQHETSYREERDQARDQTEKLQAKLQDCKTRICDYLEECDQARKQIKDLQVRLHEYESRMYRYRIERDQARKQIEDLQDKLQEYKARICKERDQYQKQTDEIRAKLQQRETRIFHYREECDQAQNQTKKLQAKLQECETRICYYLKECDQIKRQTEELQAKLQEYETEVCHYRAERDHARKQTEEVQAKLQECKTRMFLYHEEQHDQARASTRALGIQVNTPQSQVQAAATISSSDPDRLDPSAHSGKCGYCMHMIHLSGTNKFKTIVRTRRGLVQMLLQKPIIPLNHRNKPRVIVKQSEEHYYETGRLMYTGQFSGKEIAGIQLDRHRGQSLGNQNDGTNYLGKQYFVCPAGYTLYLPLFMVYIEAGSMKCPLYQDSIASELQLQYPISCTAYAGGQVMFPQTTRQTVKPGGLFGSAQQQSSQTTYSSSATFQGVSEETQPAFGSGSGGEEGGMGGVYQLAMGTPKQRNSGLQLQSFGVGASGRNTAYLQPAATTGRAIAKPRKRGK